MIQRIVFLFALTWPLVGIAGGAERIFHVRDFGALPDGRIDSGEAIRATIAAAVAAAGTAEAPVEVVFEAGTYRARHDNQRRGYCFPIHQAAHLTVRGARPATKIVIADPTLGGFHFGVGQQVTLRDLVIDYDPLPFCQGTPGDEFWDSRRSV